MKCRLTILAVVSLFSVLACAPAQPPKADPFKDDVIILQKQFLELQRLQNETRAKLEESNAALTALSGKVRRLEERQSVEAYAGAASVKKPPSQKKTVKKVKKKARRQE